MKLYIRADANQQIGIGHIMRCLSIADAAKLFFNEIVFILADDNVQSLIIDRGFKTIVLHSDYSHMEEELDKWPDDNPNVIIIDSYYVTHHYFKKLGYNYKDTKLVYIDDRALFPYPVDILVNYNIFGADIDYNALYKNVDFTKPKFILGVEFAPLRKDFISSGLKEQSKVVRNVLISTGGADPEHLSLSIIKVLPNNFVYHLLLGSLNKDKQVIKEIAEGKSNIVLHENIKNIKQLFDNMDIAVAASGSTMYELCSCGVPVITFSLADNQIIGAESFEKRGLAINIGDARNDNAFIDRLLNSITELSNDYNQRKNMGALMQRVVDGHGAERIIKDIID